MATKDSGGFAEPLIAASDVTALPVLPDGRWRDGLCNCFAHGCCHQTFCCGYWCTPVLLAQVMTRLRLTWQGAPGVDYKKTFKIVVIAYIFTMVVYSVLEAVEKSIYGEDEIEALENGVKYEPPMTYYVLSRISSAVYFLFWIFMLYIIINTRRHIRRRSNIPEKHCSGCEDCCCALFCSFCTVTQMARHTVDYNFQNASCCSETGLSAVTVHTV